MRILARDVEQMRSGCKKVVSFPFSKYLSVYKRWLTDQNVVLWVLLMTETRLYLDVVKFHFASNLSESFR